MPLSTYIMSVEIINFLEYNKRIPIAVIHRHIIPYTYNPQSKPLLRDIRSNVNDYNMIEGVYFTMYNENILLTDLLTYHKSPVRLVAIIMRHIQYKCCNSADVYKMILNTYYIRYNTSILRNIRCIWGLMTPEERNDFINTYILRDE
jgi:hypothetical protein